jgi:putative addiction module killer protein
VSQGNLGDCEPVGEGVSELRIDIGPGYRVYFGEDGDDVILLGGGDKSTQAADIKSAKERWRDYNAEAN